MDKIVRFLIVSTTTFYPLICGYSHTCRSPLSRTLYHISESGPKLAVTNIVNYFRITPVYTNQFLRAPSSVKIQKEIVEFALDYWSKTIKPKKPFQGVFRASRGCIRNEYELHQDTDGQVYEYCLIGCRPSVDCFGTPIPRYMTDKCRMLVDGKPTVTEEAPGRGLSNTDYVLFVDAANTALCGDGTLAYTAICQTESTLDRPMMGYINFCTRSLSLNNPYLRVSRDTALHEMAHAFGFDNVMFAFLRTENGDPRTPRDNKTGMPILGRYNRGVYRPSTNVLEEKTSVWISARGKYNRTRTLLKTPKLLETARNHFGCPSLDGVELENQGGSGTASAHFEKRVYLNELMVGSISFDAVVSPFVLAFFQDSGWYDVDTSRVQDYRWAKGAGCDFVFKSCYEYMNIKRSTGQSIHPWCDDVNSNKTLCLDYANAFGLCNLGRREQRLSKRNQYFLSIDGVSSHQLPFYGGEDDLTDFCPYWAPVIFNGDGPNTFCNHPENSQYENKKTNLLLEGFGDDAICFNHNRNRRWKSYQCNRVQNYPATTASCHKFQCVNGSGLIVQMGDKWYSCPVSGGSVRVDTVGRTAYVQGRLECPTCRSLCGMNCPSSNIQTTKHDPPPRNIPCPLFGKRLQFVSSLSIFIPVLLSFSM